MAAGFVNNEQEEGVSQQMDGLHQSAVGGRMMTTLNLLATIAAATVLAGPLTTDETRPISKHIRAADARSDGGGPLTIDPREMFERLVTRYRDLSSYEDRVMIEQITARDGERAIREETQIACQFNEEGSLEVTTPTSQMGDRLGVRRLLDADHPAGALLQLRYNLWLAPHLALRFLESPLEGFRHGIDEGFTPVKAERVTVEDVELVRLDLQSGDGLSEDFRARFELFINPATMLIHRVRGVQLLPDGANLVTDFVITPTEVITSDGRDLARPERVSAAI